MAKKVNENIVFEDALCMRCNKAVAFEEIKDLLSPEELS
jgi:hypothetical protein